MAMAKHNYNYNEEIKKERYYTRKVDLMNKDEYGERSLLKRGSGFEKAGKISLPKFLPYQISMQDSGFIPLPLNWLTAGVQFHHDFMLLANNNGSLLELIWELVVIDGKL